MATHPLCFFVRTSLLILITRSVLSSCLPEVNDSYIFTSVNVSESSDFDNATTAAPSAEPAFAPIVAGGENNTEDASIAAGIRNALTSLGMEVSRGCGDGAGVTARVKMSKLFHPLMLVPGLIVWGFAPVIIATLKWLVWQAVMFNHTVLMSAWYLTLRNIVFGPRPGNIVKYANHGYGPNRFHHYHRH